MSEQTITSCHSCRSSHKVRFCQDCALLSCVTCLDQTRDVIYVCTNCTQDPESEICGSCGSVAEIDKEILTTRCPSCSSKRVQDPQLLIDNLPSAYYEIIGRVETVYAEFIDLYRSFDFMVGLVRFCRLGNLYGFPQMEMQLELCSNAMDKINKEAIEELTKIRQEGLYDLRSHDYFRNIELQHYRNLDGVLRETERKVTHHIDRVRYWINEVQTRLDNLGPTAIFLRKHYEMLNDINRYLPSGVQDVVAVIPPIPMRIKTKQRKENDECYIVFTEKYCVFLPKSAIDTNQVVNGIKVEYADLLKRSNSTSLFKGVEYVIELKHGKVEIHAPPEVLDRIDEYFGLIDSKDPCMVGSPKKIIEIEKHAPDKNEYKRAANKVINIFREWLFEDRIQQEKPDRKLEMPSMRELQTQLKNLEQMYSEYNYQARNHQIPLDRYQSETTQIKDNYAAIRDKIARLSGHFGDLDPSFMGQ